MKLKAYAKINLTLDITGRREDGYHTLDTVMHSVSVWDEVEIKRINKPGIRLFCNREYLPVDTKNTAFRAAQYFFERCGITGQGLSIHIRKYIPSRAGMGGGSADAAAVLHGLNQMFRAGLPLEALVELGGAVDVIACASHGVLSGPAVERIEKSVIKEVIFLDTIPARPEVNCAKIKYLSVAEMFAEAIERIYQEVSISKLFR